MSTTVHHETAAGVATIGHEPDQLTLPFKERYEKALHNQRLAGNITRYQQGWRTNRFNAVEEIEFAELRDQLKARKTEVQDNLEAYVDKFQAAAEKAGATVHRARNAEEANRIVHEIAQRHGITTIAKSKSMVSEEIELNHYMAERGIEAIETDLGEWLVQMRGERPSHIVGPALHLGRHDVGELLSKLLDKDVDLENIPEQVWLSRNLIRPAFFEAGMGITGSNALIAESGTVMMCTNEGNGRLTSSMPPVHVVLAGIEKLIPTFEDAATQLRLLARSGTGQRMTVYSTFITGPTPGHEMHIVLVDNGRRAMNERPEFREALACIRCGACANVCPPYREVGGHVFGYIYTGAIGLVVTPFHHGLDAVAKPQSMCLSCNACETVCPVGIPLPRQILDVRQMVVEANGVHGPKKGVLAVYGSSRGFDLASRVGSVAQAPLTRGGKFIRAKRLPGLNAQTRWRSMPALARKPLRDRINTGVMELARSPIVPNGATGKTVALFPGCMTDRLYPEQGEAVIEVLKSLGVRVAHPLGLHCCGLPANNSGDAKRAKSMARQTITALERVDADYVLSGSASCTATLAQDYIHLFRKDPVWRKKTETLAARMVDFTTFLDSVAQLPKGSLASADRPVITYHDSCQGCNALGLKAEPRRILQDVCGYQIREMEETNLCCGFGGSFSFDYPEVSARLMNRKLDNAQNSGATVVVTDNQGCIMHLRGGADAGKRALEVRHLAELVLNRINALTAARA